MSAAVFAGTTGGLSYAAGAVTGDLDVRVHLAMSDWTPAAASTLACYSWLTVGDLGWIFYRSGSSTSFQWRPNGTTGTTKSVSTAVPFADGDQGWLRVTLDVDNGAGQNVVTFYTSTDGIRWSVLGASQVTAGTTSLHTSTGGTPYVVGRTAGGGTPLYQPLAGTVHSVEIRDGIDGALVAPRWMAQWSTSPYGASGVTVAVPPVGSYGAGPYGAGAYSFTLPEEPTCYVQLLLDGVWTDVSDDVDWSGAGVQITRGRSSPTDGMQPATLTFTVRNAPDADEICHWSPDNPLSRMWPHLVEGTRVRVRAAHPDHQMRTRYAGWIEALEPVSAGILTAGTVVVTCTDVMGMLARRTLLSDFAEVVLRGAGLSELDLWPLDDAGSTSSVRNAGQGAVAAGTLVAHRSGAGSASVAQAEGIRIDGAAAFTADEDRIGPVLVLPVDPAPVTLTGLWARLMPDAAITTTPAVIACGWAGTECLWRITVAKVSGKAQVQLRHGDGTLVGSSARSGGVADGRWMHLTVSAFTQTGGAAMSAGLDGVDYDSAWMPAGTDASRLSHVVCGGYAAPNHASAATSCAPVEIGTPFVQHRAFTYYALPEADPSSVWREDVRVDRLLDAAAHTVEVYGWTISAGTRMVQIADSGGRDLLTVLLEVAATCGGMIDSARQGQIRYRTAEQLRQREVVLTITAELDDDAGTPPVLRRGGEGRPTRVTASSPVGEVTAVDAVAEAAGVRRDGTVETCAASVAQARHAAEAQLAGSGSLALGQVCIDLRTAAADRWDTCWALELGDRVRYGGLPGGWLGRTYLEGYVLGYVETVTDRTWTYTLDTEPADDPSEGWTDSSAYGRLGAGGTLSLSAALTSTATTVAIAHTGTPLTTEAGDYPLDLVIQGERIRCPSAPAGTSSPQTLTGITRGQAPTMARAHTAGVEVDLYLAAAVGR